MSPAAVQRGHHLYAIDRYDEALIEFTNALSEDPDNVEALRMIALCQASLGIRKQAVDMAKKAVALSPDDPHSHYVLAIVHAEMDKLKLAHAALDQALALDPQEAEYLAFKAALCAQSNDWRSALKWARSALEQDPDSEAAQQICTDSLAIAGSIDEAVEAGTKSLYQNPNDAEAHCANGSIYLRRGKHRQAAHHFREALRLEPNNERAMHGMRTALKAIFPLYRWYVQAQLWLAGQRSAVRIVIIVAVIALPRVLRFVAASNETLRPFAILLGVPLVLLIWFAWLGDSLLNVMLYFHPLGKHTLKPYERTESIGMVTFTVLALVGIVLGLFVDSRIFIVPIVCLFGFLLVGLSTRIESSIKLRKALVWSLGCFSIATALLFLLVALSTEPAQP